jgi:hypothetical protein
MSSSPFLLSAAMPFCPSALPLWDTARRPSVDMGPVILDYLAFRTVKCEFLVVLN